jgi:hypothetical protein
MAVVIDSRNPRSLAAIGLAVRAGGWPRCHLRDGQKFYAVPSRTRPGLYHLADCQVCSCEDHQRRGVECAHILAVRLHVAQVKARAALKARRSAPAHTPEAIATGSATYADLFPAEVA